VSQYQKNKTNVDFTEARDSEWQWHQLGHMQVCTSFQIDNHASTPPLSIFTDWMPFLPPNQQRQSTEGQLQYKTLCIKNAPGFLQARCPSTVLNKALILPPTNSEKSPSGLS